MDHTIRSFGWKLTAGDGLMKLNGLKVVLLKVEILALRLKVTLKVEYLVLVWVDINFQQSRSPLDG